MNSLYLLEIIFQKNFFKENFNNFRIKIEIKLI
jgi:hypothetical protein